MLDGAVDVQISQVSTDLVYSVKKLNLSIFPIIYNNQFYLDLVEKHSTLSYVGTPPADSAFANRKCVGAICCRKERLGDVVSRVYIMTLGVLAPFRRMGIASCLLKKALDAAFMDRSVAFVALHVHVENHEAIQFYLKHGFVIEKREKDYYVRNRGVDPPDGFLLVKRRE